MTTFSAGSKVSQNMHYPAFSDGEWWLESVGERCRLRQSLQPAQWHSVLAVLEPTGPLPARSLLFLMTGRGEDALPDDPDLARGLASLMALDDPAAEQERLCGAAREVVDRVFATG